MATKLTDEEIKYNSIIATQKSLVELGANQQKKNDSNLQKELKFQKLYNIIIEYNNNTLSKSILKILNNIGLNSKDKTTEILKIFENYNDFFTMNNELVTNLQVNITKFEEDYKEIREEYNKTNKEYDEKQEYWEKRVLQLREKCMDRNKTISLYEERNKYYIYNIIIKNTIILTLCLMYVDPNYLYNYLGYMLIIVIYSYYSNIKTIKKINKEKKN